MSRRAAHRWLGVDDVSETWVGQLLDRLDAAGYRRLPDPTVRGARRADFRVSWILTQLHTFVLVHEIEVATAQTVRDAADRGAAYAIEHKGGLPRWLSSGVAALPVVVCRTADEAAIELASQQPRVRFGAFSVPVVVELDRERLTTCSEPRIWGAVYLGFLGEQQRLIGDGLDGRTLPPGAARPGLVLIALAAVVLPLVLLEIVLLVFG